MANPTKLRRDMRKSILAAILLAAMPLCASAEKEKPRPKIFSIARVEVLTTDEAKSRDFYFGILKVLSSTNSEPCNWCERLPRSAGGPIRLQQVRGVAPNNLIASITLWTDNVEGLRELLKKNKIRVGKILRDSAYASFGVLDPEGHQLFFSQALDSGTQAEVQLNSRPGAYDSYAAVVVPIIHAGFIVKDRSRMDKFYKDILGFHLYWSGGMKDGETNWVDMQVPDGTDWIEYMLNVPADATRRTRGVMNHIAIGVPSVREADQALLEHVPGLPIDEAPKIGRDGKWQLNLYDPDGTRVELMEFTPTDKPCCSEYSGPHPSP